MVECSVVIYLSKEITKIQVIDAFQSSIALFCFVMAANKSVEC